MIQTYYTTAFDIYRVSSSVDVNNFLNTTMSFYSSGKGCLQPLSGRERYYNEKKECYTTHKLFSPVNTGLTEADEIHIGTYIYDVDLIQNYMNDHNEVILILRK